jgi:DNA-binding NarL/FixJ family response regulator
MPENNGTQEVPSPAVPSEATKIRIVVADDHPIFRDGLCRLLALEPDFEVVAQAQDGRQVLDVLQQHEPDILLLDLKMPGLDGLATLQRLQNSKHKTRVIVLTASEDKNEFVQAMKLGTSGIVLKQSATDLLIKSIRKVNAGEIWLDSHTTAAVMRQFATGADEAPAAGRPRPAAASASVPCSAKESAKSWRWWRRVSRTRKWPRRCSSASRP